MSLLANSNAIESGGYNIERSLRFRKSASAYLNRTFGTATDQRKWTVSFWMKRGILSASDRSSPFWQYVGASTGEFQIRYDTLAVFATSTTTYLQTNAVFRDPSAWYHVVVKFDSTNATASNRINIYVNGTECSYSTDNRASYQNQYSSWNQNATLGMMGSGPQYYDGYLADFYHVDGQALTPSSFGQTDPVTGVWTPKKYTGTYGNNGFYLDFKNNTSATTLAYDKSGNGNNWTPNNISTTSGATYDSMTDVPTLTSATAANYCTLNPVYRHVAWTTSIPTDGNLLNPVGTHTVIAGTQVINGKIYWEVSVGNPNQIVGIISADSTTNTTYSYDDPSAKGVYCWTMAGYANGSGIVTTGGPIAQFSGAATYMFAVDVSAGKMWVGKDGVWNGDPSAGTGAFWTNLSSTANYVPWVHCASTSQTNTAAVNFGQRPFSYTPPTGFKALNTFNLPDPTIKKPNQYMDVKVRTGAGAASSVTGIGFQPDFVWVKDRTAAQTHGLFDSVRGVQNLLQSNATAAELTSSGYLTAFNSDGYSFGSGTQFLNANTDNYVDWLWKKGATPGFDIVTFTGTGAAQNISHSLGVAPSMMIVKQRGAVGDWWTYHKYANANPQNGALWLNLTNAWTGPASYWNNTAPTSSVFTVGTAGGLNANGVTQVAYLFSEIPGFSKFGSYTGNGSTDGPFVYCGFRPKYVMIKTATSLAEDWYLIDTSRSPYNETASNLFADLASAEDATYNHIDILSNGFKMRSANGGTNYSGATLIYAAFAENPFKYSTAR